MRQPLLVQPVYPGDASHVSHHASVPPARRRCAFGGSNTKPTPLCPRVRGPASCKRYSGRRPERRGLAEQLGRRRGAARGIDVEVRRIHGDRGPQPGARRTVRLFQRLDSPTGLVAVADRRLVLVIEDGLSQRLEQRHEPRHTVAQRTGGHRQALLAQPPRNPVQRPGRLTTPTQWCRRAYGRTAGAVRARPLPGASQRSRTHAASADAGSAACGLVHRSQ